MRFRPRSLDDRSARRRIARLLMAQGHWCATHDSPLYGSLLARGAEDVEAGGVIWSVLRARRHDAPESALALRLMGATQYLALSGAAPELARCYDDVGAAFDDVWSTFSETVERFQDALRELVLRPVQTNEVGRSAALVGGFLLVAQQTGLPFRLLELGSSAGLNLLWDHFRYEGAGVAWGEATSPVRLRPHYEGTPPPFGVSAAVVERRGCDAAPVDPLSQEGRLILRSYVWPDQRERIQRLESALSLAERLPPVPVDRAAADAWLVDQLGRPTSSVATVVFHSIVMQYLTRRARERIEKTIAWHGQRARQSAPLAWLRMEPGGGTYQVRLTLWPGGSDALVATAGEHGSPVRWLVGAIHDP
ncbi:MAG: DUF2332 domain-containing protein [Gaiellaceae bacterium]